MNKKSENKYLQLQNLEIGTYHRFHPECVYRYLSVNLDLCWRQVLVVLPFFFCLFFESVAGIDFAEYEFQEIGSELTERPWITDLNVGDVSGDGLLDIAYCEGQMNAVGLLIGRGDGTFDDVHFIEGLQGPSHVEILDVDLDGDADLLVACMGIIFPNNDKIGSVVIMENLGNLEFKKHVLVEHIARVTDVQAGDLDGDGDLDLSIAQFGYIEGEVRWMENLGDWRFESQILSDLPGAIHSPVCDFDSDGDLDIVSLISQQWEEIHMFRNEGDHFETEVLFGSLNEDYGSSGIEIADLDQDGDQDILYTNGDGFDYAIPGSRPWHGVQWLENDGKGGFEFHRIGDFEGAYSPIALDVDSDGDLDVVAVSWFNDWSKDDSYSLMCFENDGSMQFKAVPIATKPTHLVVLKAGDFDKDGIEELVTGGFHAFPPWENMSRIGLWKKRKK